MGIDLEVKVLWGVDRNDPPEAGVLGYGVLSIEGVGKKHGTVVDLTKEQRELVDEAMKTGYLQDFDADFKSGQPFDWPQGVRHASRVSGFAQPRGATTGSRGPHFYPKKRPTCTQTCTKKEKSGQVRKRKRP